jgi:three-Cys-motif partner protein
MATKDLHEEPFDSATVAKLEIFEDYAQEWIPTFVMSNSNTICIFDFFAGTGFDVQGVAGSPIRILEKIREQVGPIFQKQVRVKVFFNEKDNRKCALLKKACEAYLEEHRDVGRAISLSISDEDFEVCFDRLYIEIKSHPSLVYLDQNGIKWLSNKYLLALEQTTKTDFLYFVSASYFWRFGNQPEFQSYVSLDLNEAKKRPYRFIHRSVLEQLKKQLPIDTALRLYPFSIKKGANIHGIIFGASHPLAVNKFLNLSWKKSGDNGEANFDIEEDSKKSQGDLFEGFKLTKLQSFKQDLRDKVLSGELKNNHDVFNYVLNCGHIGSHAQVVLKELKAENRIEYEGTSPLVTYDNVFKSKRLVTFKVLRK